MSIVNVIKPKTGVFRVKHPTLLDDNYNPVEVFDLPDGSKGPLEIYVVGQNSKQFLDFQESIMKDIKGLDRNDMVQAITLKAPEMLAGLITGWLDNGALSEKYSPEEALALTQDPENRWLVNQLSKFVEDESNFF